MACLDTNVIIDLNSKGQRRQLAMHAVAAAIARREPICVTRVSEAELFVGVERARDPVGELAKIQSVLIACTILELDAQSAREFGRVKSALLAIGRPTGDLDMLIAAICLANGQSLITRNAKHFADVPGLVLESY